MLRIIEKATGVEYNVILEKISERENGGLYEATANNLSEFVNNYVDTKTQEPDEKYRKEQCSVKR